MKRTAVFLIILILTIFNFSVSAAPIELYYDGEYHTYKGNIYSLYVNGEKINPPLEPIIFNNRALVPLREVFEALGETVDYNNNTREITVSGNGKIVILQIGNSAAVVNGERKTIPDGVVPKLITKVGVATKTMVPVRFVSESVGLNVEFDADAGAIKITSAEETVKKEQITINTPTVTKSNDLTTVIKLKLDKAYPDTVKPILTNNSVLYFDMQDTVYKGASQTEINHGAVKKLRLGLHDDYTRVAVDMENFSKYDVSLSNDKKMITITVTAKSDITKDNEKDSEKDNAKIDKDNSDEQPNKDETKSTTVSVNIKALQNYTPSKGVKYVVIDAGHGGSDPGTSGSLEETTYYEKDLTLSVAKAVKEELESKGIAVIMTRSSDTYPSLTDRSALANKKDAAMFVSIHANSAPTAPNANGIEVYYSQKNNRNYYGTTSKAVADEILKALISKTGAINRGVKSENHVVTRTSYMPAVLIEIGFMSNEDELTAMIDKKYQQKLASAIAEGISTQLAKIKVPDRKTLAEKLVAEEIGSEKAKEYINEVWK